VAAHAPRSVRLHNVHHIAATACDGMDAEQSIAEIEWLERIFAVPDTRPPSARDLSAANRRHDEKNAHSPWFQLWQRYGVCCRVELPVLRLGELES
jgi:hypothetical protein